jgi:hypothetical protein
MTHGFLVGLSLFFSSRISDLEELGMIRKVVVGFFMMCAMVGICEASCGAASCPLLTYTMLVKPGFDFGVHYEAITQDQVYVGNDRSTVGAISGHEDEVETFNKIVFLSLGYTFLPDWRVRAELPYVSRKHEHIHRDLGSDLIEKWDIAGFGDTTVFLDHQLGDFGASVGVKLPTGKTHMKNDEGEEAEVPLQPGTGSTDYSFAVFYRKGLFVLPNLQGEFVEVPLSVGVSYTLHGKGSDDWQFGDKWLVDLETQYRLTRSLAVTFDVNGKWQEKAKTGGHGHADNTGGAWIYASPGIRYYFSDELALDGMIQLPVYQDVNGIQLTAPYNLRVGMTFSIN